MTRRVLIAEDSALVNDLVAETLEGAGYDCVRAFDGAAAVAAFAADPPDAVILDLNLPKIHGLEVLRVIKRRHPEVAVVVLTGHGSEQTALHALRLGANDYLTKPFRKDTLLESLRHHLKYADLQRCVGVDGCMPPGVDEEAVARGFIQAPTALIQVNPEGRVHFLNRAAARLLSRSPGDLLGQPMASLVAPDVRDRWLDAVRHDAGSPRGYEGEVYVEGGGGPFSGAVRAVEGPDPGWLILSIRDLTRQKAFEKHYFESKKLASLGRVVEGVAHEVRNPLLSIGGFARKLQRMLDGDERSQRYLGVVLSEVDRLEQMVDDIEGYVAFSRENRPRFQPVDLRDVLARQFEVLSPRLTAGSVRVVFEPPVRLPRVYADPELAADLFHGLLLNAVEAMPEGGALSVDLDVCENWVLVRVRDTGVGIPEEDIDEIFDPFFTSKTSGAGLGLAKAYLIVEEHAGTIELESREGEGTLCTVALPIDRRRVVRGMS